MERRQFLGWMSVGMFASCFPMVLAACSKETQQSSTQTETPETTAIAISESQEGFVTVGTIQQLDQDQAILDKTTASQPILVVRNPENRDELVAVNATCPHRGCFVEWKGDEQLFVCPCHTSKFSLDGQVLSGPSDQGLNTYESKLENDSILVKVGV